MKKHNFERGNTDNRGQLGESQLSRLWSLDVIRIVAIMAVVMIHVSSRFVLDYSTSSKEFVIGNFFDSISRLGVPLFMMTSGALMLDEEKTVTFPRLIQKNIKNIVILFLFWSAVYCCIYQIWKPWKNGQALDAEKIIWAFINGHEHMWYLYAAVGLYIVTPFLRLIVKKENRNMVFTYLCISMVVLFTAPLIRELSRVWSGFDYIRKWLNKFELQFFCGNTAFYLMGWYLVHGNPRRKEKLVLYILGTICAIATILYVQYTKDLDNGYSRLNILNFLYASSVFCAILDLVKKYPPAKTKAIHFLSRMSFGVYITHILILHQFRFLIPYSGKKPFIYLSVLYVLVFGTSLGLSWLLSKIPVLKKTVRM